MSLRHATFVDVETRPVTQAEADVAFHMDEDAFKGFYERTSRLLWAYLARVTGDRQLADDLLQETYYRFLRAGATFESEAHRRHYLFRVATNLARDGHRRKQSRPVHVPHDDEHPGMAGTDRSSGSVERRIDVTRAMARLKPRERAMLWLAYGQGATHVEIAEVVGVRTGSVKPLLFRARRRLAGLLGRGASA